METWMCGVRDSIWRVLALGLLSFIWFPAGSQAQPVGPEALVEGFVRAWNTHDTKAFGDLFTEDADWVTVAGVRVKGRADIQAALAKEHATWAKTTTLGAASTVVRSVRPDVAVILFNWEITGAVDQQGKAAGPFLGNSLMVAAKQADGWIVIAGQAASARSTR